MEVYILDGLLRRWAVVDQFESLIWTERFQEIGDCEILLTSTSANRKLFTTGKRLALNESLRVMTVETVENATDSEGKRILKVKGRSIESVLEDRTAVNLAEFETSAKWNISGTPGAIVRHMFDYICVQGTNSPSDVVPFLGSGPLIPDGNIPESTDEILWAQDPEVLYKPIKEICDIYDLGFRLIRNPVTNLLRFDIYSGSDRTRTQTVLPAVVFSEKFENLVSSTELSTIESSKNCAFVYTEVGSAEEFHYELVYAPDVDPAIDGFDRKMLFLKVSLEEEELVDISGALQYHGLQELTKHRATAAYDGEIDQWSQYKYGTDYHLGDLLALEGLDGRVSNMRATEQIFVHDEEGERSYPTLVAQEYIGPGSWSSPNYNKTWAEMGATEYWSNQP
jgi:hypothetical protein